MTITLPEALALLLFALIAPPMIAALAQRTRRRTITLLARRSPNQAYRDFHQ